MPFLDKTGLTYFWNKIVARLNTKADKTELDTHDANTTKHITSTERTNWNAAKTHADSAHAPSDAQKNQNAFSNIAVSGQTTVAADTTTDTVTFAGSNVTITTDATNDKVTFSVANGSTSAKGVVQLTNSTSSTSTTTAATPNSVKSAYDLANTAKTNAATAQTRADDAYELASGKAAFSHTHTKSQITDFPTALKNPNALTIDGYVYDGSSAMSVNMPKAFYITVTESNGSCTMDKTPKEICEAYQSGCPIYAISYVNYNGGYNAVFTPTKISVEKRPNTNIYSIYLIFSWVLNSGSTIFKETIEIGANYDASSQTDAVEYVDVISATCRMADRTYVDDEISNIYSSLGAKADTEYVDTQLEGKADSSHTHAISDVSGLQSALDGKAASSHGTHVSYSSTAPVMDGTASVGSASTVARSDHRHPTDTSRAAQTDLDALEVIVDGSIKDLSVSGKTITYTKNDGTTGTITTQDNNTDTKVTQTVTTTDAEYPLLASTTASATSTATTTARFASGVTLNPADKSITATTFIGNLTGTASKATNDVSGRAIQRVYNSMIPYGTAIPANTDLNVTDYLAVGNYYCSKNADVQTMTNCPTSLAFMMQVYSPLSTTIDNETTKTWVYRLRKIIDHKGNEWYQDAYAGATANSWTYGAWKKILKDTDTATTSAAGAMSADMVAKLNGIATGANKTTVDSALSSSSTNPVQNAVVTAALDGKAASSHNHAASNITSGTLSSDRLPTVPIAKGGTGATTAAAALTNLGITATAAELNKMDGVTATTAELNYVDGVTSNIQTQLNAKVPTSRTVNGKALSANITLSASDVGATQVQIITWGAND